MPFEMSGPADEALLREVLRNVIEKNTTFCLVASDGMSERIFYFAIGGIRVIASGVRRSQTVGEALVSRGDISLDQFNGVMESVKFDDRRFTEAALHAKIVDEETLQKAVEEQVAEEILDVFFWEGAEIILTEGQPPKSFYEGKFQTAHVGCDVATLVGGVLERVDVWRETVPRLPNGREVYEVTEKGRAQVPPKWARLLGLLDGTRTASDAIEKSGARRVGAFEFLMLATKDGRVRRTVGSAAQRVSREQLLKEIEILEAALRTRVESTIVRTRLARTLEQAGELARAAGQWRAIGDQARRVNELDRALAAYAETIRTLPTDFATRELVLEIHRHRKDRAQILSHGRPLADLFIKHNLLNRAKHLLLQLVSLEPSDAGFRRSLIFVLMGLGERDLAVKHLRELAKLLESRNAAAAELRDVYIRLLALDPRDKGARKRFEEITGIAGQRRTVKITIAAAATVVAALAGCYVYESGARSAAVAALESARTKVREGDLSGARSVLEEASGSYRMSRVSRHIDGFLKEVEKLQRDEQERALRREKLREAKDGGRGLAAARDEKAAVALVQEARRLTGSGHAVDAHRILSELTTLHPATEVARSVNFPLAIDVLPADAVVLVNGVARGKGSLVIEYPPSSKTTIQVEAPGFEPFRDVIEDVRDPQLSVSLHKKVRWTYGLAAACDAAPAVGENAVYVAGRDRFLTSVALSDGTPLWRVPLGLYADVAVPPALIDGLVVVATAHGALVAVAADSGEVRWSVPPAGPVDVPLLVTDGSLVVTTRDGAVRSFDATGAVRWSLPAKTVGPGAAPAPGGPGTILWVDSRGSLAAVSAADGKPMKRAPMATVLCGTPALGTEDRLWAYAEDESVRLIAASSGVAMKRFPMPRVLTSMPVALHGDGAFASAMDGSIAFFTPAGDTAIRRRLPELPGAPCSVDDETLWFPGAHGNLYAVNAKTGDIRWRYDAKAKITARPTIAPGVVVFVTANGTVTCIER